MKSCDVNVPYQQATYLLDTCMGVLDTWMDERSPPAS